jgi:hypothetical protein
MAGGNWFAVFIGFGCVVASVLATFVTPETSGMRPPDGTDEGQPPDDDVLSPAPAGLWAHAVNTLKQQAISFRSLFWDNKHVGLLLSTFLFTSIGKSIPLILMQYITKRFHWSWAEVR